MTAAAKPIQPLDDADIDDPDTALSEAFRDSERPSRVLRAQEMARQKLRALGQRLKRAVLPAERHHGCAVRRK